MAHLLAFGGLQEACPQPLTATGSKVALAGCRGDPPGVIWMTRRDGSLVVATVT